MNHPLPGWISESQLDEARPVPESDQVRPAESYRQALVDRFHGEVRDVGSRAPWEKLEQVRFLPGELTVIAGINNHGKSRFSSQLALGFVGQSEKVCVANMEQRPEITLDRMARMVCAKQVPEISDIDRMNDWWKGKLWLYARQGTTKPDRIEQLIWACYEMGIQHVFIDSLGMCGIASQDYEAQADFAAKLLSIAQDTGIHIFLIHHIRKREGAGAESRPPAKDDIRGAGEILDRVDNCVIWWEDEPRLREGVKPVPDQDPERMKRPEYRLIFAKSRNAPKPKSHFGFWSHQDSLQYVDRDGFPVRPMMQSTVYGEYEPGEVG